MNLGFERFAKYFCILASRATIEYANLVDISITLFGDSLRGFFDNQVYCGSLTVSKVRSNYTDIFVAKTTASVWIPSYFR